MNEHERVVDVTKTLLGAGIVTIDDFLYVDAYPLEDRKTAVTRSERRYGGLIGTALAAAARLGQRCTYTGRLGQSQAAREVGGQLEMSGIAVRDTDASGEAKVPTAVIIVSRDHGARTIFYQMDAESLIVRHVDEGVLDTAAVVLVDHLGTAVARAAHARGVPVVVDLEWPEWTENGELYRLADHLIVSHEFAGVTTGLNEPDRALMALHGDGRRCTAVTCGGDGVYFVADSGGAGHLKACKVPVLNTTGCGDVFHGAYCVALIRGDTIEHAVEYASAAAAIYASREAGWEHLPVDAEVRHLLRGTWDGCL